MFDLNEEPMSQMYEENQELKDKIEDMENRISEMREEHCREVEDLAKKVERERNLRIFEARRRMIQWMKSFGVHGVRSPIDGSKKIGEVKKKPFIEACQKRFNMYEAAKELTKLWLTWHQNIKDPAWYPFKRVGTGESLKEEVDEEDEKLKNLKEEWGEEVMYAVKAALEEIIEFNNLDAWKSIDELLDIKREGKDALEGGIFQLAVQQIRWPPLHTHERISAGLKSHDERVQRRNSV